jgi:sucrose-6-phosphate hydrolase SacC (GH32 family)
MTKSMINRIATTVMLVAACPAIAAGAETAATPAKETQPAADRFVPETPAWPENPPQTWPVYHLAHPGPDQAIPADPNCAIFHNGRYHLHYIYQSTGHSFAHLSSTDMVHWQWHPTVLTPPKTGHGMFSGTAFLTKEGRPAIIYHGQGSGRNQIAVALDDDLNEWSRPIAVEPRTAGGKPAEMRHWDPDCRLMDGCYYALGGGKEPTLAKSDDLRNWEFLGGFLHPDFPADLGVAKDEDISCANIFRIGGEGFTISSGKGSKTLRAGYVHPPFELRDGEGLTLRIFIDKSMIEVFANDRQAAVAWHEVDPEDIHVRLYSKGGDLKVKKVSSWKMKSIHEEPRKTQQ